MGSIRVDACYCLGLFMGSFAMGIVCRMAVLGACFGAVFASLCFMAMFAIRFLTKGEE